jgi:hypothetical protein
MHTNSNSDSSYDQISNTNDKLFYMFIHVNIFFEGVTETLKWQNKMAKYQIQMRSNETPQMQKKIPCKWQATKIQVDNCTDNCHVIQNTVDFQAECVQKLIKTMIQN